MSTEPEKKIRAITICQPWAWAILNGPRDGLAWKRFENRTWNCDYRGPLVIHAGKSDGWMAQGMKFLHEQGISPLRSELTFGAILGVVDMVDCIRPGAARTSEGNPDPFASGPYCHEYANPRRLARPIEYRGQQGMFFVPRELVAELLDDVVPPTAAELREEAPKAERIERAIAAAGGLGVLRPAAQAELFG